jgi:23S rRNA (cytosine1962-C5)-methyltransferase
MIKPKTVFLKRGKEIALQRKHPWIFSGAIHRMEGEPIDGDLVEVIDAQGNWLCAGHYHGASIAVRILTWSPEDKPSELAFWEAKIAQALSLRQSMKIIDEQTNCFRLVHGEGDLLSGLIIDIYGSVAVLQCHSIGMFRNINMIAKAVVSSCSGIVQHVYNKSKESLPKHIGNTIENGFLIGSEPATVVKEYGHQFKIDWVEGQKTGFFLDQRENRKYLKDIAFGKSVLNTFCYTGGFSVYALAGGASHVTSIDVSAKAMVLTDENVQLNRPFQGEHISVCADVLQFFKTHEELYDIIILDPPAFAKTLEKRHNAVQGYKRLNMAALRLIKPGGLLFTFSCSQVIDNELFQNTIVAALLESGRQAQIVKQLGQGPDHPVFGFHPEGHYLKGLVLRIL